jgi:hypothetical protein
MSRAGRCLLDGDGRQFADEVRDRHACPCLCWRDETRTRAAACAGAPEGARAAAHHETSAAHRFGAGSSAVTAA